MKMQVDGVWDDGTTAAAKRWQERKGMDRDGTIEADRIVFAPGARRVSEVQVAAGASAGGSGATTAAAGADSGGSIDVDDDHVDSAAGVGRSRGDQAIAGRAG